MIFPVEKSNTPTKSLVSNTSRYLNSNVLLYGDNKVMTFETYKKQPIQENQDDRYAIVTAGEEFRPDRTSFRAYNTPDYWWRIMEANNIKDVFDYKSGLNIRLPTPFNV